jgi:hypothetical protein
MSTSKFFFCSSVRAEREELVKEDKEEEEEEGEEEDEGKKSLFSVWRSESPWPDIIEIMRTGREQESRKGLKPE